MHCYYVCRIFKFFNSDTTDDITQEEWLTGFSVFLKGHHHCHFLVMILTNIEMSSLHIFRTITYVCQRFENYIVVSQSLFVLYIYSSTIGQHSLEMFLKTNGSCEAM